MWNRDGIHWRMPSAMIACYIIGLGLAVGHHFYYYSLDDTTVGGQTQQAWALRMGTGLAFLTRTFLTTAVGIACVQNLWWILRLKPVRISTVDSMFDIRGSIFNFFDLHIWLRGPNVAILGLVTWLIPLVTVVTPSTLSVHSVVGATASHQRMSVIDYDFFKFTILTEGGAAGPTYPATRFVTGAVIQGSIPTLSAPAPNSSYTRSFVGPLIDCIKARSSVNASIANWHRLPSLFEVPYLGFQSTTGNISKDLDYLFNPDSSWTDPDFNVSSSDIVGKLVFALHPIMPSRTVIECGMYNASYVVNFNYENGAQITEITNLTVLNRVPAYRDMVPSPPANADERFSYTAIMDVFVDLLAGVCHTGTTPHCIDTQIFSTALGYSKDIWEMLYGDDTVGNVKTDDLPSVTAAAAELGRNITLSLFSDPYFLTNSSQTDSINVTIYQNETKYQYSQKNLLIAYGVSIFVALLCVISGLLTMIDNGFAFTDSFSTILRATRHPDLDDIVPPVSTTGADPYPQSLSKTMVQWIHSNEGEDGIAGLKPLPADEVYEKVNLAKDQGPISFLDKLPERKLHQHSVSDVSRRSDGFI